MIKDTLNVRPGESYEIAFTANNPGDWMFHCRDLHHAAAGMIATIRYERYPYSWLIRISKTSPNEKVGMELI